MDEGEATPPVEGRDATPEAAPPDRPEDPPRAGAPDDGAGSMGVPSSGPPPDAVTSYEDLPADLFGETGGEPDPPPGSTAPDGARDQASAPAPEEARATQEDTLAKVGRAFPGRIVAIDPASHLPEGDDDPSTPVAPVEDAPVEDAPGDPPDPAT